MANLIIKLVFAIYTKTISSLNIELAVLYFNKYSTTDTLNIKLYITIGIAHHNAIVNSIFDLATIAIDTNS